MTLDDIAQMISKDVSVRANIFPMIDAVDEDLLLSDDSIEPELPILPVMDQVLFPGVIIPIAAQRSKSRRLLSDVSGTQGHVAVFTQQTDAEEPGIADLCPVGVVARVLKVFHFKEDISVAILQGTVRCHSLWITTTNPYLRGTVTMAPESPDGMDTRDFRSKMKLLRKQFAEVMRPRMGDEDLAPMLSNIGSNKIFINFAATHLDVDAQQKYELLSFDNYPARVDKMLEHLSTLRGLDELRRAIDTKTREEMERQQREYYLRQQMNVIQEELGTQALSPEAAPDVENLRAKAEKAQLPKLVAEAFERELGKMARTHPQSSDYTLLLTYLETLIDIPWNTASSETYDIAHARQVLDRDHFGIQKVKERIIEYLAVRKRQAEKNRQGKAQVLCLVGPPGTGKTSICRSIAQALDRPYRRVALGGLHDEAEIRGHRRTYVGAMPGRIMQEIIKAKTSNPVFVLDEVDKVQHASFHGDPASALLEVLDPEQNCHFHDNYVDLDYDLSRVFFIATANSLSDIPHALLDRMEVIDFSGYVIEEKLEIARRHILPRVMHDNVLDGRSLRFSDDRLRALINDYTREAGVRQLEKQLSKLVRHRVVMLETGEKSKASVDAAEMRQVLGLPIHNSERRQRQPREGVVTGLAWTPVGGEILFIEASLSKGKGTLTMTGNLGDVMKESATLAFEYIKSNAQRFGVDAKLLDEVNLHIHVPEGATPKDGPSAGITMFVAMLSALSHRLVQPTVAMTGEITLRGNVTPVGGIKEKILAAKRAGITDIILSEENRRDIEDIEPAYLSGLQFHYITEMSQALPLALVPEKKERRKHGK